MEGLLVILCVLGSVCFGLTQGCDISACLKNNHLMIPQSCKGYTDMLQCIKKEYDSCTDQAGKTQIMMGMQYVMRAGVYCGYDMNQLNQMMQAHTGLMTSLWNSTGPMGPMGPMMMGGDGGPFGDDGPMDDGPMDDGPFDDGPFDDGPFDDMGEGMGMPGMGMYPFMAAGGATGGKGKTAGASPGVLPAFRKGTMRQRNDQPEAHDVDSGSDHMVSHCWSVLTVMSLVTLRLLH